MECIGNLNVILLMSCILMYLRRMEMSEKLVNNVLEKFFALGEEHKKITDESAEALKEYEDYCISYFLLEQQLLPRSLSVKRFCVGIVSGIQRDFLAQTLQSFKSFIMSEEIKVYLKNLSSDAFAFNSSGTLPVGSEKGAFIVFEAELKMPSVLMESSCSSSSGTGSLTLL